MLVEMVCVGERAGEPFFARVPSPSGDVAARPPRLPTKGKQPQLRPLQSTVADDDPQRAARVAVGAHHELERLPVLLAAALFPDEAAVAAAGLGNVGAEVDLAVDDEAVR